MASPNAGAPALKYRDVNTVTPSSGEVKGLICWLTISKFYILGKLDIILFCVFGSEDWDKIFGRFPFIFIEIYSLGKLWKFGSCILTIL